MQIFIKLNFIISVLIFLVFGKCTQPERSVYTNKYILDTINAHQIQIWYRNLPIDHLIIKIPFQDTLFRKGQMVNSNQWESIPDGIEYYTNINGRVINFRIVGVWEKEHITRLKTFQEVNIIKTNRRNNYILNKSKNGLRNYFTIFNEHIDGCVEFLYEGDDQLKIIEKYLCIIGKNITGFKTNNRAEEKNVLNNLSLHNIDSKIDTIF